MLRTHISLVLAAAIGVSVFSNAQAQSEETRQEASAKEDVTELSDMQVTEDPLRALSLEPSASAFGFSKPLLETPRTVSFISEEQINLFALNSVEDLVRVVPGAFTTTRFGIQGGIDVRNVPADTYFRGMKRINLQGHSRTVLAAMDSIEVVKGPPSPIYGMGKIGGYTNVTPKSGRAKIGGYLYEPKFVLSADKKSYLEVTGDVESRLPHPMPISLMVWAGPGSDSTVIKVSSAYEAASKHRVPPPAFGPVAKNKERS